MTVTWLSGRAIGAAACALCVALVSVTMTAQQSRQHVVRFTTDDAFDAGGITPYAGRHDDVYGTSTHTSPSTLRTCSAGCGSPPSAHRTAALGKWRTCLPAISARLASRR